MSNLEEPSRLAAIEHHSKRVAELLVEHRVRKTSDLPENAWGEVIRSMESHWKNATELHSALSGSGDDTKTTAQERFMSRELLPELTAELSVTFKSIGAAHQYAEELAGRIVDEESRL